MLDGGDSDKERPKVANEKRTALESKPDPPIRYVYFRRERGAHGSKEEGDNWNMR